MNASRKELTREHGRRTLKISGEFPD